MNRKVAAVFGFFMGIYLDILTSKQVGISALVFLFIGYICEILEKSFSKESKITIVLMVISSTFLYETVVYAYSAILYKFPFDIFRFIKILIIEIVFNGLLTIILYPIFKKLGEIVERIFKENKSTFRYMLNS